MKLQSDFVERHIGPSETEVAEMLNVIGESSLDSLISKTVPKDIRLDGELKIDTGLDESEYLEHIRKIASNNKVFDNYIGMGYYGTIVPSVIQRNIFENPGWYTAYTPYQAEIAQGRLEALLNFQTMVIDLTGMEIANASLLDEGTAAAETMNLFFNTRSRDAVKTGANKLFVSETCLPQTIAILQTHAEPLEIELVIGDHNGFAPDPSFFGAILQYPDVNGEVWDYAGLVNKCHEIGIKVGVAADIMSLVLLTPPGQWGADVVFGNSQRFG